jgi:hypothetical protein
MRTRLRPHRPWQIPFGAVAPKHEIVERHQGDFSCPVPHEKINRFSTGANHFISPAVLPHRGALAIVTDAGRDAMDAGDATDESADLRTEKSCGPGAPTLESNRPRQLGRRRWQTSPVTGESTKETVNTIACGNAG